MLKAGGEPSPEYKTTKRFEICQEWTDNAKKRTSNTEEVYSLLCMNYSVFHKTLKDQKTKELLQTADIVILDDCFMIKNTGAEKRGAVSDLPTNRLLCFSNGINENELEDTYNVLSTVSTKFTSNKRSLDAMERISAIGPHKGATEQEIHEFKVCCLTVNNILTNYVLKIENETSIIKICTLFVSLTTLQSEIYTSIMALLKDKITLKPVPEMSFHHLSLRLTCHPSVLYQSILEIKKKKTKYDTIAHNVFAGREITNNVTFSNKMLLLQETAAHCREKGYKLVIFAHCLKSLEFIYESLAVGQSWEMLTGKTTTNDREQHIKEFNRIDGKLKVLLLSFKTFSSGVDLHAAARVVFFDEDWGSTPIKRTISQTGASVVYRLVAQTGYEFTKYRRTVNKELVNASVFDNRNLDRIYTLDESKRWWEPICEPIEADAVNRQTGDQIDELLNRLSDKFSGTFSYKEENELM